MADKAEAVIAECEALALPLPASAFNSLIAIYARQRDEAKAMASLHRLQQAGHEPCIYTYSSLVHLYVQVRAGGWRVEMKP